MTYKYSFFNDYSEGAHPRILEALVRDNFKQEQGYGEDSMTLQAADLIREKIENKEAAVHFVSGGTQANLVVLASILKSYESVIAADTAHISLHEAGAIEATGHEIHKVKNNNGKVTPDAVVDLVMSHSDEHMTKPRAVFISQSTEFGTLYTRSELEAISIVCKKHKLYLYLDGARIGSALASSQSDLDLPTIAKLVDVFYIGGTKNGAFLGEAIVLVNKEIQENFRHHLKQRGALLAKGRALGIQFLELFKDDLFFSLAHHANTMAVQLRKGIADCGFSFLNDSLTNQVFPIFPYELIEKLETMYGFYRSSKIDSENSAVRLVTSWATQEKAVEEFVADLRIMSK